MRLADEITVDVAHERLRLRPTLRAAARLHDAFGGFDRIIEAIRDGNLSTMLAVVRESAPESDVARLLEIVDALPLQRVFAGLAAPLLAHVYALTGHDPEAVDTAPVDATPAMTFGDYHAKLFRIGTGWLGWTPAETWDASPAEILEAYKGRGEMLRAIFGGEDPDQPAPKLSLDDQIRLTMAEVIARKRAEKAAA